MGHINKNTAEDQVTRALAQVTATTQAPIAIFMLILEDESHSDQQNTARILSWNR